VKREIPSTFSFGLREANLQKQKSQDGFYETIGDSDREIVKKYDIRIYNELPSKIIDEVQSTYLKKCGRSGACTFSVELKTLPKYLVFGLIDCETAICEYAYEF
jgi:hypothetical protein